MTVVPGAAVFPDRDGVLIREATTASSEVIDGAVPAFDNLLQAAR